MWYQVSAVALIASGDAWMELREFCIFPVTNTKQVEVTKGS